MSLNELSASASSPLKKKINEILTLASSSSDVIPDISNLSIANAVRKLTDIRYSLPNKSPLLSKIDAVLIPLMTLEYHDPFQAGPYDISDNSASRNIINELSSISINQNISNCLLSDIDEKLLFSRVSDLLEVHYLSEFEGTFNWSDGIRGCLYGAYRRPMVSIPVSTKAGKQYNVHFLVDTGAPSTEVPETVLIKLLGREPENIPSAFFGKIGGQRLELFVCSSTSNHKDVPVLGQNFFAQVGAKVVVDYDTGIVEIFVKRIGV
jgi:predicted aspartyl protease